MHSLANDLYLPRITEARQRMDTDAQVARVLDPAIEPRKLLGFLINFCSRGVYMTEPVESWIRRAGEHCVALGMADVGASLVSHAHHEAGHHTMMRDDTRYLVSRWNSLYSDKLDAERTLAEPPLDATREYVELHERTIASDSPFAQVAIEFEIERLSVVLGPKLLAQFRARLGDDIVKGLSFLEEHVRLDVGHTRFNERLLEQCLTNRQQHADALVRAGSEALAIYARFLGQCLSAAEDAGKTAA